MSHTPPDHRGRMAWKMFLNGYEMEHITRALRYPNEAATRDAIKVNTPEAFR